MNWQDDLAGYDLVQICLASERASFLIGHFYHLWFGPVAQWLEQGTHNPLVVGSSPTGPTKDN